MTTTWAYLATHVGASVETTLALAEGTVFLGEAERRKGGVSSYGIVHRRFFRDGKVVPGVSDLAPGDRLVLMHDALNCGLYYPLGQFDILEPASKSPPRVEPWNPERVKALGMLFPKDAYRLEPDYSPDESGGRPQQHHLVLLVKKCDEMLPENAIGHVFYRPLDGNPRGPTILPWESLELSPESETRGKALDPLQGKKLSTGGRQVLEGMEKVFGSLDGRSRQLVAAAARAELLEDLGQEGSARSLRAFSRWTLPAYALCGLAEYEMLKVLKRASDRLLAETGCRRSSLRFCTDAPGFDAKPAPHVIELPLAPAARDERYTFAMQANAVAAVANRWPDLVGRRKPLPGYWQRGWTRTWRPLHRLRNRVSHSFFVESGHLMKAKDALFAKNGLVDLLGVIQ